jgi:predicted dehydrogenase
VALLEGSWDLPRSFQDLEVFGRQGSLYVTRERVEVRKGKDATQAQVQPLPPERAEPIAYMVHCLRTNQPLEGMVSLPINVQVLEILDAAKESIKTGRAVRLPAR